MTIARTLRASAVLGALFIALQTGSAAAQDATAVAQRLKETLAAQGAEFNWSSATGSGGQVVLDGVTYGATGMPPITLGKVTLDNVVEANGGYTAGTVTFPAFDFAHEGVAVAASESTLTNVRIPAAGQTDFLAKLLQYDSGKIDRMEFKFGDKQVALVENTHFEMTPPADGKFTFTGAADRISADLSSIPDPQTQAIVTMLGYQQITGNVQLAGSWNTADGRMELSKYDIDVDNAGKIGMTIDISGYTPEFMQALQEIQKQMIANGGGDQNAQNVAALGMMQQLVFNGASLRFDDASLTDKALNLIAMQQGADPAQLKEQTKTIIPFLLASSPLKDEALKKNISEAVAAYIDNPKSLTVSAKPASPQPFSVLAMQGQADPASLTKTLGVTVTAND